MNIRPTHPAPTRRKTTPLTLVASRRPPHGEPAPAVTAVAPGQTLLHAGQHGALWRVSSGAFRIERPGDGAAGLIQLALPGDHIGLEALFGQPYGVSVTALLPSTAQTEPVPHAAARLAMLAHAMTQQQRQAHDMARLRSGLAADRVAWLLRCLGTDPADPAARKTLPPLKDMARIIDTAPETICRELGRLLTPAPAPTAPRTRAPRRGTRTGALVLA